MLPVEPPGNRVQKLGGDHMTDYEMIIVFLTILSLLILVDKKNDR